MVEHAERSIEAGEWLWGPLVLTSISDALAPNYLQPAVASHLWCLPVDFGAHAVRKALRMATWHRRYVVQAANFLYIFAKEGDAKPPAAKPIEVVCFEDLAYSSSTISDADVAKYPQLWAHSEFAFELLPEEMTNSASLDGIMRGGRGYRFCAESAMVRSKWAATLKRSRHKELKSEMHRMQQELECKDIELRELKRVLNELCEVPKPAAGPMPPPTRRQYTNEELHEASIKLQAAQRGRLARQQGVHEANRASRGSRVSRECSDAQERSHSLLSRKSQEYSHTLGDAIKGLGRGTASVAGKTYRKTAAAAGAVGTAVAHVMDAGVKDELSRSQSMAVDDSSRLHSARSSEDGRTTSSGLDAASTRPHSKGSCREARTASSAGTAARDAMQGLHERQEKLDNMAHASDDLAHEAEDFAQHARRIRMQAERQNAMFPF